MNRRSLKLSARDFCKAKEFCKLDVIIKDL